MSYRIEISPNNRAGCKDGECKKQGIKLMKGEIRFGTWVEINDHGSWQWRHWGCTSGKIIENIREKIESDGTYNFDLIDGYDELDDHPDVKTKIRRAIEQGHVDDADFRGDIAFNKLGQKGIRGRAKKEKPVDGETACSSPVKPSAKRGRKKADSDDEDEEEDVKPKKKAKKSAGKSEDADEKPTPKARGKKASKVKEDEQESDILEDKPASAKKGRSKNGGTTSKAKKVEPKEETEEEGEPAPAPAKKARGKKTAASKVKEETDEDDEDEEEEIEKPRPAKKARGKKAAAKKEPNLPEDDDEEIEEREQLAPKAKAKAGRKTKTRAVADADDGASYAQPKRGRSKKA